MKQFFIFLLLSATLTTFGVTPEQIEGLVNRSPLPTAQDISAITATGNTVVIVAVDGTYAVSRDRGITWTSFPKIPDVSRFNPPSAIIKGGTRYVATALGRAYVSTDLETWTDEIRIGNGGYDITFAGGKFITVGDNGAIQHSPDGETWTAASNVPTTEDLRAIATDGTILVAGGQGGQLLRSTDGGDTWSLEFDGIPGESGFDNAFRYVSYANNLFLATARNDILYTSPNGTTWTARDLSELPIGGGAQDIVHDGTQYIISGGFTGSASSPDLVNFTELEYLDDGFRIEFLAETGGAVISGSKDGRIATFEGTGWRDRSQRLGDSFETVIFADGQFVISDSTRIFSSLTGKVWSFAFETSSNFRSGVAYGNGRYVIMIGNDDVATSTDGINWTETEHDASGVVDGLVYLNNRFIMYGRTGNLYQSQDGISWTQSTIPGDYWPEDITYGKGLYVIAGNSSDVLTSPDFVTWTARPTGAPESDRYVGVEFAANRFVALNRSQAPAVSEDGISWSLDTEVSTFHLSRTFTDPAANGLGLYTFGTEGTIRYYPDPTDLSDVQQIQFAGSQSGQALATGNGSVVLVGGNGLVLSTDGDATGYAGWVFDSFPFGDPRTGPSDDYDGDGIPNLAEYARGSDPTATSPAFLSPPEQTAFGPEITWTQRTGLGDVTATAEFSNDLISWSTTGVLLDSASAGAGMESITARFTGVPGTRPIVFVRLRWDQP